MSRIVALLLLSTLPGTTWAQLQTNVGVPERGHGSVALTYQHGTIHERTLPNAFGGGLEKFGEITRRTAMLEFDYGLTDRLAVNVLLPFRSNRYRGTAGHDPSTLIDEHGQPFLEDGRFHSNWGDWGVGLRWLWRSEPIALTPFVSAYVPSHDYPLFTETQAGTQQWKIDVGLNAGGRFGHSNVYWQAGYAYSYLEKTKPQGFPARRVNHSTLNLELGWRATPSLTLRGNLAYLKTHHALRFPEDFGAPPFVDDRFYYHDQLFPWEGSTGSLGAVYTINDRYTVSADVGRTLHQTFGHLYRSVVTIGVSRTF